MTDPDPFDEGVPRGRYGRPLIIPAGRGGKPNLKAPLVEYDRASTVADALDTGGGLAVWQTRHAVLGVAWSPDLADMAAALGRDLNTFSPEDKRNLDAIIAAAHDRSGGNVKANHGTAVHSLTEPGNDGRVPDAVAADVASYLVTIDEAGIEVVETEVFVVNDELKVAGTFDHTYRLTRDLAVKLNGVEVTIPAGSTLIGDKKTGSLHFEAHAIQLAIYARGKVYNHNTGEREALDVSPQYGVVAHIPRLEGTTTLHLVDLHAGWEGAKLAMQNRAYVLGARKRLSTPFATRTVAQPTPPSTPAPPAALPSPTDDPFADTSSTTPAPPPVVEPVAAAVEPVAEPVADEPIAEPVVAVTAPEPPAPADDTADAVAAVTEALGDGVLDQIRAAPTGDACRALWSACKRDGITWTDEHTAAVVTRLAELGEPTKAAA